MRTSPTSKRVEEFVKEALVADRVIAAGGEVHAASEVHAWLARLARGERVARPKPCRVPSID